MRTAVLALLLIALHLAGGGRAVSPARANEPARPNNILLPSVSEPEPLQEIVFFAFDAVSFPQRKDVALNLIQGKNPRRVLATGPKGSHDELWGYFTILRIGDRFHLWVMTQSVTPSTQYLCYATSKDGIEWEKPELGLVEFNGSKKNNIIESPLQDVLAKMRRHLDDVPGPLRSR